MIVNREDQTTTCATFAAVPLQRVAVSSATNVHVRFKVDTSVEPPQVYSALVRAVNRVGNGVWSCPSANDLIYRAPPAPRGRRGAAEVSVTVSKATARFITVVLFWDTAESDLDIEYHKIYEGGSVYLWWWGYATVPHVSTTRMS